MNRKGPLRNIAASVRARLTQRARDRNENVQLALTRYAIERLLYRLSLSPHRERFILKGAMLFSLWAPTPYRATGDLDLLGYGEALPERVARAFHDICSVAVGDDGVTFEPKTLRAEPARIEDEYSGVRLRMRAEIAGAGLPVQVDVGFGDAVTPAIQDIAYPSLLDMPVAHLRAYPPETVIAEKFQALVALGVVNSRMKDFFDLWAISETLGFEGAILASAIHATFERRVTPLPAEIPIALTTIFSHDSAKRAQWRGFLERTAITLVPGPLPDVLDRIAAFTMPPTHAARTAMPFAQRWTPGGPWAQS